MNPKSAAYLSICEPEKFDVPLSRVFAPTSPLKLVLKLHVLPGSILVDDMVEVLKNLGPRRVKTRPVWVVLECELICM
jgi:hypothetical protein